VGRGTEFFHTFVLYGHTHTDAVYESVFTIETGVKKVGSKGPVSRDI